MPIESFSTTRLPHLRRQKVAAALSLLLLIAFITFYAFTLVRPLSTSWPSRADNLDRSILILAGGTLTYAWEVNSHSDDQDFPRLPFSGRRGWRLPCLVQSITRRRRASLRRGAGRA